MGSECHRVIEIAKGDTWKVIAMASKQEPRPKQKGKGK
jgi:hypothetical protein